MKSLVEHLSDKYYICSYRDFCLGPRANDIYVGQQIQKVRDAIDTRNIVFTDWEHQRVLRYDPGYNFVGFKAILGENYQTNKWAVSVPTFGHKDFGEHQFSNLDMLIYVNSFNKDYDVAKIDHSKKLLAPFSSLFSSSLSVFVVIVWVGGMAELKSFLQLAEEAGAAIKIAASPS